MSAPYLTLGQLRQLEPCEDDLARMERILPARRRITAAQAREYGATLDDLVWAASALARNDKDVERRLRLWMADCAAHILNIYEATGDSPAPRSAIIAARQFACGQIDDAAAHAAADAAYAAADAVYAAYAAAYAAYAAAHAAADAVYADADADADADAASAAHAAYAAAYAAADADAEQAWQFDRLITWFSDAEPKDWPLPKVAQLKEAV